MNSKSIVPIVLLAAALTVASCLVVTASPATPAATGRTAGDSSVSAGMLSWGRYEVATRTYDLGSRAYKVPLKGVPRVELAGVVHAPRTSRGKKFPLVVFEHGLFDTCAGADDVVWPCPKKTRPIPSYRGYDYIAKRLASHGYVVVSISANGINAYDNGGPSRKSMTARGLLVQKHLDLWRKWATRGGKPFGKRFLGAIDFRRVGTMGHSRGGEGVVRNYEINAARGRPYGIKAVFPLESTDKFQPVVTRAALGNLIGQCAGAAPVGYYDRSRYLVPQDPGAKHTIYVLGANHNYFNTIWTPGSGWPGAGDDMEFGKGSACRPGTRTRLTPAKQREVAIAYVAGFFRYYLGGERSLAPMWRGQTGHPNVLMSYQAPGKPSQRLDVNRMLGARNMRENTLGGAVTVTGSLSPRLCGGPKRTNCLYHRDGASQPHNGEFTEVNKPGLSILMLRWQRPGGFTNAIPAGKGDVRRFKAFVFRASQDFTDPLNPKDRRQNLRVTLTDGHGRSISVPAGRFTRALDYAPRVAGEEQMAFLLNQVRIPLAAFSGIDLRTVRKVSLDFGVTSTGSLGVTDLAFST